MKIAVIILNYNSSEDCCKCVGFLVKQRGIDLEIIIVDNTSRPDDASAVRKLCSEYGLTFIAADNNRGYNAGNNIGLRYAASKGFKYAFIANPDMEFPNAVYISRLVEEMETYPNVLAAGTDILTPEGIHQNPMMADGDWITSFGWIKEIIMPKRPKDKYDFIDDYKINNFCAKLSGCALMVRMSFIEKINFFDEYPFLYCEEAILAKQAKENGWQMRYIADTQAIHRHINKAKGDPRPRFRQWKRSRLYFVKKYAGYSWHGRILASLSWKTYLNLMIITSSLLKK